MEINGPLNSTLVRLKESLSRWFVGMLTARSLGTLILEVLFMIQMIQFWKMIIHYVTKLLFDSIIIWFDFMHFFLIFSHLTIVDLSFYSNKQFLFQFYSVSVLNVCDQLWLDKKILHILLLLFIETRLVQQANSCFYIK